MKPMRCHACSTQTSGNDTSRPDCDPLLPHQPRIRLWERLKAAAAFVMIILLISPKTFDTDHEKHES